ncbi:MAG: MarR family transcriptional regulator [Spirochaetales bacterium]|nr:MarR family transcriptional regulator [Spirochaetales bacterium]
MKQNQIIDLYNIFIKTQNQFNSIKRSKKYVYKEIILYSAELQVLGLLKSNNLLTVTNLSEELFMTKSAISQLVKKLYSKKLITKTRNIENERIVHLEITDLGDKVINHFLINRQKELGLFISEFTEMDKMQYDSILMFYNKLSKMFDKTLE